MTQLRISYHAIQECTLQPLISLQSDMIGLLSCRHSLSIQATTYIHTLDIPECAPQAMAV